MRSSQSSARDIVKLTTADISPAEVRKRGQYYIITPWQDVWQFVIPSLGSKVLGLKTPWRTVDKVYVKLKEYLRQVDTPEKFKKDMTGVDHDWPSVREILRKNWGMTRMMLDHGCQSRFLYKVIQTGAQAILLEVFHGRFISVAGDLEYIPYSDSIYRYIVPESIAVNVTTRTSDAQKLIADLPPKQNIMMCGAGLLPELRVNGFDGCALDHEILAVDLDERNLKNLNLVFDKPLSQYRVKYEIADIVDVCNDPANAGKFALVIAQGVMSYYRKNGRTAEMLKTMLKPVQKGGALFFDLQMLRADLLRCATSLSWESDLAPDPKVKAAVDRISKIVDMYDDLSLSWRVVYYRKKPASIHFLITKR